MVTAYGREEVMKQAEEASFESVLIKPVTPSMLFDSVVQALSSGERADAGTHAACIAHFLRAAHLVTWPVNRQRLDFASPHQPPSITAPFLPMPSSTVQPIGAGLPSDRPQPRTSARRHVAVRLPDFRAGDKAG